MYLPSINSYLIAITVILTASFKKSANLADMYGVAVTGIMVCTSSMLILVMHYTWRTHWLLITLYAVTILAFDVYLAVSCLKKIVHYAWVSLLLALVFTTAMSIWTYFSGVISQHAPTRRSLLMLASDGAKEESSNILIADSVCFHRE